MSKLSIMVSVMQNNKFNHQLKSLTKVFVFALRTILITGLPAGHKSDFRSHFNSRWHEIINNALLFLILSFCSCTKIISYIF